MNPEFAVAIANESGVEPPSGVTITAGGTVTGQAEWRTERERERHVWERAFATIAAGTDATQAARNYRSLHHANAATTTPGHHTHRVTTAAPNRPLPAPPANQWANRPTLPYVRPTDNSDGLGPPPAAPRTAFNLYHGQQTTVNLDQGFSPARDSVCSSKGRKRGLVGFISLLFWSSG
jgi:hypothetical protein